MSLPYASREQRRDLLLRLQSEEELLGNGKTRKEESIGTIRRLEAGKPGDAKEQIENRPPKEELAKAISGGDYVACYLLPMGGSSPAILHGRLNGWHGSISSPVSTSDSEAVAVQEGVSATDPFTSGDVSAEKFDWYSHWYPLAPVFDLDKRAPRSLTVLGLDVVVWWDRAKERWRVFEDRCPHRLAPLSEGRIDPLGRLQCVYHGWCFDGSGSCQLIPQSPLDGPPVHTSNKASATSYACYVQNNILWFWPRVEAWDKDALTKSKPPCVPELDDPSYTCTMGTKRFPLLANVVQLHEEHVDKLIDIKDVIRSFTYVEPHGQELVKSLPHNKPTVSRDKDALELAICDDWDGKISKVEYQDMGKPLDMTLEERSTNFHYILRIHVTSA
ncbi:hypothetical protein HPP92_017542 [Vanilla planifolia]|uniref:Rieske domain-containing protein n=1 Tax=Vanilla planifolia TaxID=51239 RepID=A0A835UR20_VANPL|nr:hypothetical protein HPP92_017542 [Vanilla planifolia]